MIDLVTYTVINPYLSSLPERDDFGNVTPKYLDLLPSGDALSEWGARLCYKSNDKYNTNPYFMNGIIKSGHYDVLEHCSVSIALGFPAQNNTEKDCELFKTLFNLRNYYPYLYIKEVESSTANWRMFVFTANLRVWRDIVIRDNLVYLGNLLPFENQGAILMSYLYIIAPNIFPLHRTIVATAKSPYTTIYMAGQRVKRIAEQAKEIKPVVTETGAVVTVLGITPCLPHDHTMHVCFQADYVSRAFTHQHVRHRKLSFCLAEDTIIRSFSDKKWTIKELYDWSTDPVRKGRLKLIKLRGMANDRTIVPVSIKSVIYSGKQLVYRLVTRSGRTIRATENHRFFTHNGWQKLSDISVGDFVYSNGIPAYKDKEYLKQKYLIENIERKALAAQLGISDSTLGKYIRKFGLQKPKSQYPNRRGNPVGRPFVPESERQKISERMLGTSNHRWKGDDVGSSGGHARAIKMYDATECAECGSVYRLQRHHIDRNPANNEESNIVILCEPHHKAWHDIGVRLAFQDEVLSIEPDDIVDTYDIEINEDIHNFVADGIVVHNSQESQRYVDISKSGTGIVYPNSFNEDRRRELKIATDNMFDQYREWRDNDSIKKEDARCILPNCMSTRIVTSGHFDGIDHYLKLRTAKDAQHEIRCVAVALKESIGL